MTKKNENDDKVWIGPAPFLAVQYINNTRCLPGASTTETEGSKKRDKTNVQFWRGRFSWSQTDFSSLKIINTQEKRNIAHRKELLMYSEVTTNLIAKVEISIR